MSTDNSSALDSKAKVRDPEACVSVEKEQSSNVSVEDTKEQTVASQLGEHCWSHYNIYSVGTKSVAIIYCVGLF